MGKLKAPCKVKRRDADNSVYVKGTEMKMRDGRRTTLPTQFALSERVSKCEDSKGDEDGKGKAQIGALSTGKVYNPFSESKYSGNVDGTVTWKRLEMSVRQVTEN